MDKLNQAMETLNDVEYLIEKMKIEIDLLRSIVARYHRKYGDEIKGGTLEVPDTMSFGIRTDIDGCYCVCYYHDKLRIKSDYQLIL